MEPKIISTKLVQTANVFSLMSDPSRLLVMETLLSSGNELCVTEIARKTNLSLSAASHQLRKLELLGVVSRCRYGQEICYCWNTKSGLAKKMLKLLKLGVAR